MSNIRHFVLPSVTITSANNAFTINESGGGELACAIAAGTYYLRADGTSGDLLAAVVLAMNNAGADTYTSDLAVATDGTITLTITNDTDVNTVTWGTFDGTDLGFSGDLTSSDQFASDQAPRGFWVPDSVSESVDEKPRALGSQIETVGGQTHTHDRSGQAWIDLVIVWPWLQEDHVEFLGLASTDQPRTLYRCWERWRDGRSVEIHETTLDATITSFTASTLKGTFTLDGAHLQTIRAMRQGPGVPFYTCEPITWRQWVAQ